MHRFVDVGNEGVAGGVLQVAAPEDVEVLIHPRVARGVHVDAHQVQPGQAHQAPDDAAGAALVEAVRGDHGVGEFVRHGIASPPEVRGRTVAPRAAPVNAENG